jgi:pSer/pThr/pTyr-binding forkhead associated (FHA) protein
MSKRLLVIDRDDQEQFFLALEKGILTIGRNPESAEAVLPKLHISRIRCEFEVDEDLVVVRNPKSALSQASGGGPLHQELHPGQSLQIGHSHLRFAQAAEAAAMPESNVLSDFNDEMLVEDTEQPDPASASSDADANVRLLKRLVVVDGADKGQVFVLPEVGTISVGKSKKSCEVVLHDLYVSRVHCNLQIEDDQILVTHVSGDNGTLINGKRINQQAMRINDILRVGNEHLRLEIVPADDSTSDAEEDDEETIDTDIEDGAGDYDVEVVEDESEPAEAEAVEAEPADSSDPYALPHAPVDKLLKLENQTLGHYQIGPLLGRGQSSLVFRALDAKNQQLVALKVFSPDFPADDAELQRFIRALRSLSSLQNPHLLALGGAGKTGPYCWLAREYVEGESLARLIQRIASGGWFDWTRACRVAVHLGRALDFLHQHRIAHGNITPRNVLIRKSDRQTKLADLLLNRALEGSRLQKAILGKKLVAELPYLAPEQTDPHAPGTTLGDIYALGTVLYVLLTGQPPFAGSSAREMLAQIRESKVVRPSKLQRGIPAPFEAAVLLMMARRPEDRFQTAAEMLAAVQRIADEHDVEV